MNPFSSSRKYQKAVRFSVFRGVKKGCIGDKWDIVYVGVFITFKELEVEIAELQDDLQQIKLLNENLEEKINLQNVEHNEKLKSLQLKTEEIEKEKEERVKEAYKKGVTDSQNQVTILLIFEKQV